MQVQNELKKPIIFISHILSDQATRWESLRWNSIVGPFPSHFSVKRRRDIVGLISPRRHRIQGRGVEFWDKKILKSRNGIFSRYYKSIVGYRTSYEGLIDGCQDWLGMRRDVSRDFGVLCM